MKASAEYIVDDIGGKHGVKALKRNLDALPGVISVSVSESRGNVTVDYDTTGESCEKIEKSIRDMGYQIKDVKLNKHVM